MCKMKNYSLLGIIIFGLPYVCLTRPEELDKFYKSWKPLELVRGLRELSVDPFDVFRALEAVKELDSEEALDVMHDLDLRPITIYDALDDLGIEPYEAYYALKSWLTDPLLHQPGDHYHRVNVSGDPTHPYLHLVYKKISSDESYDNYKACYMTSAEIEKELKELEKEYKDSSNEGKERMRDFIKKAKAIHSAFDDPSKVFTDFFGERHFEEWKKAFPEAFKGLTDIYKNPLGSSFKKTKLPINETLKPDTIYEHLNKGKDYLEKKQQDWDNKIRVWASEGPRFAKAVDHTRYETVMDDCRTDKGEDGVTRVRYMRVYYDKHKDQYVEMNETQEFSQSDYGTVRRVKSSSMTYDPKTYTALLKERQQHGQQQQQQQQPPQQQQQQPPQQQQQQPQQSPQQQQQQQQPPQQQQQQQPQQPSQQQQQQPQSHYQSQTQRQQQQPYQPHPAPYQHPYYPHPPYPGPYQQPYPSHPGTQQSPQSQQPGQQQQPQSQPQQQQQQPWQWFHPPPPQQWFYHPNPHYHANQHGYPPQYPYPPQQGKYPYPPQPQQQPGQNSQGGSPSQNQKV